VTTAPRHTAVETPTYLAAARKAGLSEDDRNAVLDQVMSDPSSGDLIQKTGGVRKLRIGKRDSGKSGGYRVLSYFMDMEAPVFLLFVIDKSTADNITAEQAKILKTIAKQIKDARKTVRATS
jgi:hypothetical protein